MGSFSIWHWLILLAVVVMVFGTRKLRNAGGDLGAAVKNFKSAMRDGETETDAELQRKREPLQRDIPGETVEKSSGPSPTRDEHQVR